MARIKLSGYYDEGKILICCQNVKSMKSGTIDTRYISKVKIKEMEEYGYAYVNQPSERVQ